MVGIPAATLYEAAGKLGDMSPTIRAWVPGVRMGGPAYTVKVVPGDSLAVLRAIDEAPVGSVLVIDAGGTAKATIWGGTSSLAAQTRHLAGCVTNAAIRDIEEIQELGFPVFAPGVSVRGTVKNHPGWTGIPVSVGEVPVHPGDFIVGDADGVVVIPAARMEEVATRALEYRAKEQERDERVKAGEPLMKVLGLG